MNIKYVGRGQTYICIYDFTAAAYSSLPLPCPVRVVWGGPWGSGWFGMLSIHCSPMAFVLGLLVVGISFAMTAVVVLPLDWSCQLWSVLSLLPITNLGATMPSFKSCVANGNLCQFLPFLLLTLLKCLSECPLRLCVCAVAVGPASGGRAHQSGRGLILLQRSPLFFL